MRPWPAFSGWRFPGGIEQGTDKIMGCCKAKHCRHRRRKACHAQSVEPEGFLVLRAALVVGPLLRMILGRFLAPRPLRGDRCGCFGSSLVAWSSRSSLAP